ncbi:MAG: sigma-70 family RNA polymerase sigma factor [Planctomycetes bacterium]|nr:sigma-70 family RNA polymerase sigma factor [Planctomycetota bacterium]
MPQRPSGRTCPTERTADRSVRARKQCMPFDPEPLLQRASQGDAASVASLLERYLPGLRAFLRLRAGKALRARESASDLAQSVCREILEHVDRYQYRGEAEFKNWLFTTALRKLAHRRAHWNTQKRGAGREWREADRAGNDSAEDGLAAAYASFATPSRHAVAREELARVEAAFDQLTEAHREVILLARVVGLPHKEIAARMDRSEPATRTLLHRALLALSELLAEPKASGG